MQKNLSVSIIIYILITTLSGLTGLAPFVHAAITDLTPPIVRHSPPNHIIQGEKMVITAIVEDESNISWVNLWYRSPGKGTYNKIQMAQVDSKTYRAGIEVTRDFKVGIEYYIEAVDQFGNEGTDGNKVTPYFAERREAPNIPVLTTKTESEGRVIKRPWWKSPWFWVGVVAVGGGVAAAAAGSGGEGNRGTGIIIVK